MQREKDWSKKRKANAKTYDEAEEWINAQGYEIKEFMTKAMGLDPKSLKNYRYGGSTNVAFRSFAFLNQERKRKEKEC
jgi:hypothetical protein